MKQTIIFKSLSCAFVTAILSLGSRNLIFSLLFLASYSYGWDHEHGPFAVSKLRFGANTVFVSLEPAPKGCDGGSQYRMHLKVNNTNPQQYRDMVLGLLAANTTGQTLKFIWYSNKGTCSKNHILRLDMFEYTAK